MSDARINGNRLARAAVSLGLLAAVGGCTDRTAPPPVVISPNDASEGAVHRRDPVRPLSQESREQAEGVVVPARPFDDPALLEQEIPERAQFVSAYEAVGRPILVVEGTNQAEVVANDSEIRPIAIMLVEWLRCDGRVTIQSMRSEQQPPDVVVELATDGGKTRGAVLITTRVFNARDKTLLAQAMTDMPVPADRQAINRYTRFVARKLMTDLTRSWMSAPPATPRPAAEPQVPVPAPRSTPRESPAAATPVPRESPRESHGESTAPSTRPN